MSLKAIICSGHKIAGNGSNLIQNNQELKVYFEWEALSNCETGKLRISANTSNRGFRGEVTENLSCCMSFCCHICTAPIDCNTVCGEGNNSSIYFYSY